MISRRGVLFGLIAAPLIVRTGILMPVRPIESDADLFAGGFDLGESDAFALTLKNLGRVFIYSQRILSDAPGAPYKVEHIWRSYDPADPKRTERVEQRTVHLLPDDGHASSFQIDLA